MAFKNISNQVNFPALECEVLEFWKESGIFEKSLKQRKGGPEYVFYDGPPFATGLPHYGHLLAGTIKDVVPRYQTMRGNYVERSFGWDCHGLPVENEKVKVLKAAEQARHRGVRRRQIQRGVPFDRAALHVGVGDGRDPHGPLGRFPPRLPHHGPQFHGVGLVGVQGFVGQGAGV